MSDTKPSSFALSEKKRALLEAILKKKGLASATKVGIPRREPGAPTPASFAQERIWFLEQLEPNTPAYNMPAAVRMRGRLDVEGLRASFEAIVHRHESLRTTFVEREGVPFQIVSPPARHEMSVVDLRGVAAGARDEAVRERCLDEAARPFDLVRGPLLRTALLVLDENEHVVLVTMHHIVSDGWSLGIFLRELGLAYGARVGTSSGSLPDLPVQYGDFAAWQRAWLTGDVLASQLAYWKGKLAGRLPTLALPTDRPRPPFQTSRGALCPVRIAGDVVAGLRAVATAQGATLFMVCLAAFKVLLHRYSGQEDILVGSPIANRGRVETEPLIGMFLNTLVLRTSVPGDARFVDLLASVKDTCVGAFAHQDLPIEPLLEALRPERDLGRAPLFQVMFNLQTSPMPPLALPGLTLSELHEHNATAKYDLTLGLGESREGTIVGDLEYNTDLFDAATAARMMAHYANLLAAIARAPERRVTELPLMSDAERRRVVVEWNATDVAFPERLVHELIAEHARRAPDAAAVSFEGERLTYGELHRRSNQLARGLVEMGIGPGNRVGVCLDRGVTVFVALLAVLKSGAAYVPIDPSYPDDRVRFMLADSGVTALVTDGRDGLAGGEHTAIDLARDWPSIARHADDDLPRIATPDDLAYVIYTSGTSGRPKGACVAHASLANVYFAWEQAYELASCRTHLQMASLSFDVFTGAMVRALCSGAELCVCPQELLAEPSKLYELMRSRSVDIAEFVPAVLRGLVSWMAPRGLDFSFMQTLIVGSDAWFVRDHDATLALTGSGTRLINSYGLTEATIDSSFYERPTAARSPADTPDRDAACPIGKPFANNRLYVLDERLAPVPVGVAGELCVGGAGVARGYFGRPELTREKFAPSPFGPGTLYRTGDLAKYLPDGNVVLLGRIDQQVKVRGLRIELGEIEAVLKEHPGIVDAVVAAHDDAAGQRRLVAYVVGESFERATLRKALGERLPQHMVPAQFVVLDTLPLTPNGKVDRTALPQPALSPEITSAFRAPRTPVEQLIADVWAEVLERPRVGLDDHFFDLGGHSLLAMRIVSRLRAALAVPLPLRAVFEAPTVAQLASRVAGEFGRGDVRATKISRRAPGSSPAPLSFTQERLWFLDQLEPGLASYNVALGVRARGALDEVSLARALDLVVQRHEALRTALPTAEGVGRQVVAERASVALVRVDLRGRADAAEEAERRAAALANEPFELGRGPLLRAALYHVAEDERLLAFVLHHAITDGWSMAVLVADVARAYGAIASEVEPDLPALPITYADYAAWQRAHLTDEALAPSLEYFRAHLAGAPALLELPTDRPRPAVQTYRGRTLAFDLAPATVASARRVARAENATPFMVLLAAFDVLLARFSGQGDIVVGTPVAGRDDPETEGVVGFFANTLAVRARMDAGTSFRGLLASVREATLEAYAHAALPFERCVEVLAPERSLAHQPIFQVMFAMQNTPFAKVDVAGLSFEPVEVDTGTAAFDLTLSFEELGDGGMRGALEYNTDLFDAATAERFRRGYEAILGAVLDRPEACVFELPLHGSEERERILSLGRGPVAPLPPVGSFYDLFVARAAEAPGARAVVDGDESFTYERLKTRAEAIASRLAASGVKPGDRVAVHLGRSASAVAAMLGVMRVGAAFVALDPQHPEARGRTVLEDCGARVVITSRATPLAVDGLTALFVEDALADGASLPPLGERLGAEAYVAYTSGTTGRPKGIPTTHGALLANFAAWEQTFCLSRALTCHAAMTSVAFDVFVGVVARSLGSGACAVMCADDLLADPAALARYLRANAVDVADFLPSVLRGVLAHGADLSFLRLLVVGSEPWYADEHTRLLGLLGRSAREAGTSPTRVINVYGVSEAAIDGITFEGDASERASGACPIGRPLPNAEAYVLDPCAPSPEPAPVGVSGELCVGGPMVASGYAGLPELTRERFVSNPFGEGRLYRTGDRARLRDDGTIELFGRLDGQVKIRGLRIEPAEIEGVLSAHPSVAAAAVIAVRDTRAGAIVARLAAFVVPTPDGPSRDESELARELRVHLAAHVPPAAVPATIRVLDALPIGSTGKIDRRALEALVGEAAGPSGREPAGPRESAVAIAFAEVVGVARASATDNFFSLGGDSIKTIQLVARLRRSGWVASTKDVFLHPTVEELARAIRPAGGDEVSHDAGALAPSLMQRWFFEQRFERPSHYNQAVVLESLEPIDVAALSRALGACVAGHEALRLRFDAEGRPRLEPARAEGVEAVEIVELGEDADASFAAHAAAAQASLDLTRGPLLRACLFRRAHGRDRLLLVVHHLVVDAVSFLVLADDLARAYAMARGGGPVELAPATVSMGAFAAALERRAETGVYDAEVAFWREQRPAAVEAGFERDAASVPFNVSAGDIAPGAIEDTLLAAVGAALGAHLGTAEVVFEIESHGRDVLPLDTSRTVGWFTIAYPLRVSIAPGDAPTTLASVREARRKVPGRGEGYGVLCHVKGAIERVTPHVTVNFLGAIAGAAPAGGLFSLAEADTGASIARENHRTAAFEVSARLSGGRVEGLLGFSSALVSKEAAQAIASSIVRAYAAAVAAPRPAEAAAPPPVDAAAEGFPAARLSENELADLLREIE